MRTLCSTFLDINVYQCLHTCTLQSGTGYPFFITLDRYFTARMMNQLLKFIMITNYNVVRDQGTAIVESELIIF